MILFNWLTCLGRGATSTSRRRRQRSVFGAGPECLEVRITPATVKAPVLALGTAIITIPPDNLYHSIEVNQVGNNYVFQIDTATYSVKTSKVCSIVLDTGKEKAGNTTDFFQNTKLSTLVLCGIGTNNIFTAGGDTTMATACNGGTNSFFADGDGDNRFLLFGGTNSIDGGFGTNHCDTYVIAGGTNTINLGSGYNSVIILGGDNTISSNFDADGFILNLSCDGATIAVGPDVEVIEPCYCH